MGEKAAAAAAEATDNDLVIAMAGVRMKV